MENKSNTLQEQCTKVVSVKVSQWHDLSSYKNHLTLKIWLRLDSEYDSKNLVTLGFFSKQIFVDLPTQVSPSLKYPLKHLQLYDPLVLTHTELSWQLTFRSKHSSTSANIIRIISIFTWLNTHTQPIYRYLSPSQCFVKEQINICKEFVFIIETQTILNETTWVVDFEQTFFQ